MVAEIKSGVIGTGKLLLEFVNTSCDLNQFWKKSILKVPGFIANFDSNSKALFLSYTLENNVAQKIYEKCYYDILQWFAN